MQKKKRKEPYFGKSVQEAIIRYNSIENQSQKDKIFREKIYPAFYKLSEVLIHTYKFYYIDDDVEVTKQKTISFLVEKMPLYDVSKGKAYSYFTIVARNYLILKNTNAYKERLAKQNIDVIDNNIREEEGMNYEQKVQYFDNVLDYFESRLHEFFPKEREYIIAESIIEILKRRDNIENYNKKAIYILIKERTNCQSQHITSVVNNFKKLYKRMQEEFYKKVTI